MFEHLTDFKNYILNNVHHFGYFRSEFSELIAKSKKIWPRCDSAETNQSLAIINFSRLSTLVIKKALEYFFWHPDMQHFFFDFM